MAPETGWLTRSSESGLSSQIGYECCVMLVLRKGVLVWVAAVWFASSASGCSKSIQGSGDHSETGGGGGGGGEGDGDGDTGEGETGGTHFGGSSASGGVSGDGDGDGDGSGGSTEPVIVACGDLERPEPVDEGDWGCQNFDGTWPPSSPWSVSGETAQLEIVSDLFRSSPNSLQIHVPSSGTSSSKMEWSHIGGDDIAKVQIAFEFLEPSLPALPPEWTLPVDLACVDFGQIEACLAYRFDQFSSSDTAYSIQIHDNRTIPDTNSCDIEGHPTLGSWNLVELTMDDAGEVLVNFEGLEPTICQGPDGEILGTVASAWVGVEAMADSRHGHSPLVDDFFVYVERK